MDPRLQLSAPRRDLLSLVCREVTVAPGADLGIVFSQVLDPYFVLELDVNDVTFSASGGGIKDHLVTVIYHSNNDEKEK